MKEWSLWHSLKELARRWDLILMMANTQVRARYKQAVFGFGWAVLQPLVLMLLFTFLFNRMLHISSEGLPAPVFSYSVLIFWTFFNTSMVLGIPCLIIFAPILKKIYFPREIFPLVVVLASLFDLACASLVFLLMMFVYQIPLTASVFWILVLFPIQFLLTMGVVLYGTAICVRTRDIQWGIPLVSQVWMYCTPVIYSLDSVPGTYKWAMFLNPMTGLMDGYRKVLGHQSAPEPVSLLFSLVISLLVFYGGYRFFKKRELSFADII